MSCNFCGHLSLVVNLLLLPWQMLFLSYDIVADVVAMCYYGRCYNH